MRALAIALILLLAGELDVHTAAPEMGAAEQPTDAKVRVALDQIPVGARVVITLRDGRALDVFLVARTTATVTVRSRRDPPTRETLQVSDIRAARMVREDAELTRTKKTLLIGGVAAGVVVAAWIWVVKARPFGT